MESNGKSAHDSAFPANKTIPLFSFLHSLIQRWLKYLSIFTKRNRNTLWIQWNFKSTKHCAEKWQFVNVRAEAMDEPIPRCITFLDPDVQIPSWVVDYNIVCLNYMKVHVFHRIVWCSSVQCGRVGDDFSIGFVECVNFHVSNTNLPNDLGVVGIFLPYSNIWIKRQQFAKDQAAECAHHRPCEIGHDVSFVCAIRRGFEPLQQVNYLIAWNVGFAMYLFYLFSFSAPM